MWLLMQQGVGGTGARGFPVAAHSTWHGEGEWKICGSMANLVVLDIFIDSFMGQSTLRAGARLLPGRGLLRFCKDQSDWP